MLVRSSHFEKPPPCTKRRNHIEQARHSVETYTDEEQHHLSVIFRGTGMPPASRWRVQTLAGGRALAALRQLEASGRTDEM